MAKVSVIIPVYNVKSYLSKALDCICSQTLSELQIILIDDGSTDGSRELCKMRAEKDERIVVLYQKNSGVSSARNRALDLINAEYVFFMDADDYAELNMLEEMYAAAKQYHCDLVISGFYFESFTTDRGAAQYPMTFQNVYYPNQDEFRKDFVQLWDNHLLYNICNKLYRTKIIQEQDLKFPTLDRGEDLCFNELFLEQSHSFCCLKNCYYHYVRERPGSATSSYVKNWFQIRVNEHAELIRCFQYFNVDTNESREFLARRYIERVIGCIENEFEDSGYVCPKEQYKAIKNMINHPYTQESVKFAKPKSTKVKVMLLPIKINNTFFCFCMGKLIHYVRKNNPELFIRLKQNR